MKSITVRAPINIAVIKYWGKSSIDKILPCNDSISMTLDSNNLFTETQVTILDDSDGQDEFILEGHPNLILNERIKKVIKQARGLASNNSNSNGSSAEKPLRIVSRNSVPTASGLASSASGIAALAFALIKLFNLDESSNDEISEIARLGSGSACRSLFGGFVHWSGLSVGPITDYSSRFTELNGFVIVLDAKKKSIPSSEGMQRTVATSSLFQRRITQDVPQRVEAILQALKIGDFAAFADLAMRDSNSMHACCLDSFPPFTYLSAKSFAVIDAVHEFNSQHSETRMGYTFDAGQNAVIFGLQNDPQDFINHFKGRFDANSIIPWKLGGGPQIINYE